MGLMRRLRWLLAGLVGLVSLGLLSGVASAAGGCPNEALRTGYAASLPDCRAYEQVSPVDKNGGGVGPYQDSVHMPSAVDGNRVPFPSMQPFAGAQGAGVFIQPYVATRGGGGWSTRGLLPREATSNYFAASPFVAAFSSDLSSDVLLIGGGGDRGQDDPPLVAGEPPETTNLFVRSTETGASQLVDVTPSGVPAQELGFAGATPDLSHVFFTDDAPLTANAPAGQWELYEWSGGVVSLVSILPDGSPYETEFGQSPGVRFVSTDGSRVVFDLSEPDFGLYMREDGVRTVKLNASQGPGPGGSAEFKAASSDGSRVFFTADASAGLTNDTAPSTNPGVTDENLYEYDVAGGGLRDLTPNNGEAQVLGVLGASSDGAYVYFVAKGVFAAGATAGKPNLYVSHEGAINFIATLEAEEQTGDEADWRGWVYFDKHPSTSEVTPDGRHLVFMSMLSLTGYDNTDANTGQRDYEQFLYDATTGRLVCVSCNPSGARPIGSSYIVDRTDAGGGSQIFHRIVSPDGERVFFDSFDALVPQDTNGKEDVYEYAGGAVHLISTGTSSEESFIAEVSVSGNDVFFATGQQLVAQDNDSAVDLYDARVGGGFPSSPSASVCAGEACRGVPAGAPASSAPASAVFSGQGNLVSAPAPVVSAPKAKKPKPKAKHRRRKKKGKGRRSAHGARGGHSTGKRG
jgi:hypothetical protein